MEAAVAYGYLVRYDDLFQASIAWKQTEKAATALAIMRKRSLGGTLVVSQTGQANISQLPVEVFDLIKFHLISRAVENQRYRCQCSLCGRIHCDYLCKNDIYGYYAESCGRCCFCTKKGAASSNSLKGADGFLKAHGLQQALMNDRFQEDARSEVALLVGVISRPVFGKTAKTSDQSETGNPQLPKDKPNARLSNYDRPTIFAFTPDYFQTVARQHEQRLTNLARLYGFSTFNETAPDYAFSPNGDQKTIEEMLKPNLKNAVKPGWIFASCVLNKSWD